MEFLRAHGYRVVEGKHLWERNGYLAGDDAARLADLNAMLNDDSIRMIMAGRGGYGATRILQGVDYNAARMYPKIVVGFSDVTAINLALLARADLVSYSGVMPGADFWNLEGPDAFAASWFWRAVTTVRAPGIIRQPDNAPVVPLFPGRHRGPLVPANLTLLASLVGTPYLPDMDGAILVIEEIGEEAYRIDRLLSQLHNSGLLYRIGGLVLGAFTGTTPTRVSVDSLPVEAVLRHYVEATAVPALGGLLYGHIERKLTLPVGTMAEIDGIKGTLRLLESGVS